MQVIWRLILGFLLPIIFSGYLMLFYLSAFVSYYARELIDTEMFLFLAIAIMPMPCAMYYPWFIQGLLYTWLMEFVNSKIKSNGVVVLISTVGGGIASITGFSIQPKVEIMAESTLPLHIIGMLTGFFTGLILRRSYLKSVNRKLADC